MTGIIDDKGFRLNVGIIIAGEDGRVFWGRRVGNRDAWQFPQGGMMPGETRRKRFFASWKKRSVCVLNTLRLLPVPKGG